MSIIQLSLDLATSLTIIVSLFVFLFNQRKRQAESRKMTIDISVREAVIQSLEETTEALGKQYVSEFCKHRMTFDYLVKGFSNETTLDSKEGIGHRRLVNQLYHANPETFRAPVEAAVQTHLAAYELVLLDAQSRYTYIPLLDALPGGRDLLAAIKNKRAVLVDSLNRLKLEKIALVNAALAAVEAAEKHITLDENGMMTVTDMPALNEIFVEFQYNPAYREFIGSLNHNRDISLVWSEDILDEELKEQEDLRASVYESLIYYARNEPGLFTAIALEELQDSVEQIALLSKGLIIGLSAALHVLVRREIDEERVEPLKEVVNRFEEPYVFDLKNGIL